MLRYCEISGGMMTRKACGKHNKAHDAAWTQTQARGSLCLAFGHRLDARTHVFRNEGSRVDRQGKPKGDQRPPNGDATCKVKAFQCGQFKRKPEDQRHSNQRPEPDREVRQQVAGRSPVAS